MLHLMRRGAAALTALLLLLALGLAGSVLLALERVPLVPRLAEVSVDDVARANALLQRYDPRRGGPSGLRTVDISGRDAELLFGHLTRRFGQPTARLLLQSGTAMLQASLQLPRLPGAPWLNVDAVLLEGQGLPVVERLQIGRLPVPGWLAAWAIDRLTARLADTAEGRIASQLFRRIAFHQDQLQLVYEWRHDAPQLLLGTLLPPEDQARLQAYVELLARITPGLRSQPFVPMTRVLLPVFALARERSAAPGGDAEREHRAALIALAFFANNRGLRWVVPAAANWPRPLSLHLTLAGRVDFPLHYLVSAAIAAEGGGPLADAVGLFKEVTDSRAGSGFSFGDLAADRAGTRFGLLAVREPARLQAVLARGVQDEDLMPDVQDLPEYLPQAEFNRRFGGVGAPAYRRVLADIEARLDATPVFVR